MNQYRSKDGERLDIIVFKAYQNIDDNVMKAVMEVNQHLLDTSSLTAGDIVFLPDIATIQVESESKALW